MVTRSNKQVDPNRSVLYQGSYAVWDASVYVRATTDFSAIFERLSTKHIYAWVREGIASEYLTGRRGKDVFLTFLDLVTLRAVAAFRASGLTPKEIVLAHRVLCEEFQTAHPFATEKFWAGKHELIIKKQGRPMSVLRRWQQAFEFLTEHLTPVHGLIFDSHDMASGWVPYGFRSVLFDPAIQFGEPCIKGTRIPTEAIWAFHDAGDSLEDLALMYGKPVKVLKQALIWERRLQEVA